MRTTKDIPACHRCRVPLAAFALLCASVFAPGAVRAQSTIDASQYQAWGANLGWTNWLPGASYGPSIGEYICQGYLYSANVGWITLGSGAPANHIRYQNNSGTDWGVNYFPGTAPGVASLRGYAYGANIGWINFEATGNPSVNLLNGQLYGYAYSANCGWINLGTNTSYVVKTDTIAPGVDTDGDGIADAWEYLYFGNLTTANATSSYAGDGVTDLQKYLEGVNPTTPGTALHVSGLSASRSGSTETVSLTFVSTPGRLYKVDMSPSLTNPNWTDSGLGTILPGSGTTTTVQVASTSAAQFYRVRAVALGF